MHFDIKHNTKVCNGKLKITGSKSETNRLLLIQAFISGFKIQNKSNSEDSKLMSSALQSKANVIDVNHAGTAMRFLLRIFLKSMGEKFYLLAQKECKRGQLKYLLIR